jgi:electron transfer flavoprotein alpha/beta subunit
MSAAAAVRVLVAFKVTPDFELLRDADWAAAAERGVETRYVRRILNCFDESALELALRAAGDLAAHRAKATGAPEAAPAGAPSIELGAVSVGGREVEPYLTTLIALGFERATRIDAGPGVSSGGGVDDLDAIRAAANDLDFAPAAVALLIAAYARRVDRSDLVLLGSRSGPGDGGTVPFRVAEELGWPCLSQVTELEPLVDGRLRATCATDDGLARLTLRGPCVLAVGNAIVSNLRAPTLKERLSQRGAAPGLTTAGELGVDVAAACRHQASALLGLEAIDRRRASELVDGPTPQAKATTLYETHLRPWLTKLRPTSCTRHDLQ